ncbi:hypothetical protein [Cypionkella sp. TWP1-2-1b2]|uniref:hypothetical protein n=1 Tax=Cypionkella sp. TWP1-2-1b2 TaxID=2804675 RepID=UPI003CF0A840
MFEAQSRLIKAASDFAELTTLNDSDTTELAWLVKFDDVSAALESVSAIRRGDH